MLFLRSYFSGSLTSLSSLQIVQYLYRLAFLSTILRLKYSPLLSRFSRIARATDVAHSSKKPVTKSLLSIGILYLLHAFFMLILNVPNHCQTVVEFNYGHLEVFRLFRFVPVGKLVDCFEPPPTSPCRRSLKVFLRLFTLFSISDTK